MAVCYRHMSKTGTTDLTTAEVQGTAAEDSEPELDGGFVVGGLRCLSARGVMRRTVSSRADAGLGKGRAGGQNFKLISLQLTGIPPPDSLTRYEPPPARSGLYIDVTKLREPEDNSVSVPSL